MELFPFQIEASNMISERYKEYKRDPLTVTRTKLVPFYQNLSSITGSGKTIILADTLQQIRTHLSIEPIVLWLSKGKVVVWQTYNNLSSGKYSSILNKFVVKPLLDTKETDIKQTDEALLLVATVGKFNQRDKEDGDRKVFQVQLDEADNSLWEMLKERQNKDGFKRDLIIVYDEGHNLSEQQTKLLLELDPDALIAASATMRVPEALNNTISRLQRDKGWGDQDFYTVVKSSSVVESGLIKKNLLLGGYLSPMEFTLDDMMEKFNSLKSDCLQLKTSFSPKAIYVTNTNVISGLEKDDIKQPFKDRMARPIVIWRYLVEQKKVDPKKIAVYCNLKFDKKFPPPEEFILFSGGDNDYNNFIEGNYEHIIFNQTLQEGWDDPSVYFAYIDKDMGSSIQVTQVIGRVLRQPSATHYSIESLNTAHFFIRTDEKSTFEFELNQIQNQIAKDSPEIEITYYTSSGSNNSNPFVNPRFNLSVPEISVDSSEAKQKINQIISTMNDYTNDLVNTVGKGGRIQVLKTIGNDNTLQEEWVEVEHNNKVAARWIFAREIQKSHKKALNLCDIEDKKFDALVEYSSNAALNLKDTAQKVIKAYVEHSIVLQNDLNLSEVSSIPVNKDKIVKFKNSVHEGYSDLNKLELEFAKSLDKTGYKWLRNPSRGFFEIPLLDFSKANNFNPDFIVWKKKDIIAIDTKGEHLIAKDATSKLFNLTSIGSEHQVKIRLVTKGEWANISTQVANNGYTLWLLKNGRITPLHFGNLDELLECAMSEEYN